VAQKEIAPTDRVMLAGLMAAAAEERASPGVMGALPEDRLPEDRGEGVTLRVRVLR